MSAMPLIKITTTVLRSLIFLTVLLLSESNRGSADLLSFMSIVTLLSIAIGFGSIDGLVKVNDFFFNKYIRVTNNAFVVLILLSSLLFLNIKTVNIMLAALYFGFSFWILGEIRRYSLLAYELLTSFHMLIFWLIYLTLVSSETEDYKRLTALFGISCLFLYLGASYKRKRNPAGLDKGNEEFLKTASSKLGWEITYSMWTRNAFLFWNTVSVVPSILSYVYYVCELFSAAISHYQSIFLNSDSVEHNVRSFGVIIGWLAVAYLFMFAALGGWYIWQDILIDWLGMFVKIDDDLIAVLRFDLFALLVCFFVGSNIFSIQVIAYLRYALHLHNRQLAVLAIGVVLGLNLLISAFAFTALGIIGVILSNLLMCISAVMIALTLFRLNAIKIASNTFNTK